MGISLRFCIVGFGHFKTDIIGTNVNYDNGIFVVCLMHLVKSPRKCVGVDIDNIIDCCYSMLLF